MEFDRNDLGKSKIELIRLVEILQDEIDQSSKVPFSSKVMVNQEVVTEIINEIIQSVPSDFNTAQYVLAEKDRILEEANSEYNRIKMEAEEIMRSQVNEHTIVRAAEDKARDIVSNAQTEAKNMRLAARDYTYGLLTDLEKELQLRSNDAMVAFKKNMEDFVAGYRQSVDSTTQTVRENIQELSNMK